MFKVIIETSLFGRFCTFIAANSVDVLRNTMTCFKRAGIEAILNAQNSDVLLFLKNPSLVLPEDLHEAVAFVLLVSFLRSPDLFCGNDFFNKNHSFEKSAGDFLGQ